MKGLLFIFCLLILNNESSAQQELVYSDKAEKVNHDYEFLTVTRIQLSKISREPTNGKSSNRNDTIVFYTQKFRKGLVISTEGNIGEKGLYTILDYKYDRKGRLKELVVKNELGRIRSVTNYTYLKNPKMIVEELLINNRVQFKTEFEYSDQDRLVRRESFYPYGLSLMQSEVLFDIPDSIVIIQNKYSEHPELNSFSIKRINANEKTIRTEVFKSDSTLMSRIDVVLDPEDRMILETVYSRSDLMELMEYKRTEFVYSNDNQPLIKKQFIDSELYSIEEFKSGLTQNRTIFSSDSIPETRFIYEYK